MPRDFSPLLPRRFDVVFRARRCAGSPADGYPEWYESSVNLSDLTLAVITDANAQAAQDGTSTTYPQPQGLDATLTLRDSALAQYTDPAGDPTNKTALDALAQQLATDLCNWRSASFDTAYMGVVAPDPTGLHDLISWEYSAGRVVTRERSRTVNGEPEEFAHQDPAVAQCVDAPNVYTVAKTPAVEMFAPTFGSNPVLNLSALTRKTVTLEQGRLFEAVSGITVPCVPCANCDQHPMTLQALGCPGYGGGASQWPLPNAPITITYLNGAVLARGTTDSKGEFLFVNGTPGQTYVCLINAKRFNPFVKQFTCTCGSFVQMNVCRDAGPAPGYACCQNFPYPLKTTLWYTDKNGTRQLQFLPGNFGPGGNCAVGNWITCYNAPTQVADDGCINGRAGETPVQVGYCPYPSYEFPTVGCPPIVDGILYTNCAAAPSGASFFPRTCDYISPTSEELTCETMGAWSYYLCTQPPIPGSRGLAVISYDVPWSVSVQPPNGFAGTGSWPAGGCNPITGTFSISE